MAADSSIPVPQALMKCSEINAMPSKIEAVQRPKWVPPTLKQAIRALEQKKKDAQRPVKERRGSPSRWTVTTPNEEMLSMKRVAYCIGDCGGSSCELINGTYYVRKYKTRGEERRCVNLHPRHEFCFTRNMNPENFGAMEFSPFAPVPPSWVKYFNDEYPSIVFAQALCHCYTKEEILTYMSEGRFRLLDSTTIEAIHEEISKADLHAVLSKHCLEIDSTQ
jgi:hypothetical protein